MRPKMNPESFRTRWYNRTQRITELRSALATEVAGLEELRGFAVEDGLTRELRALEMPPKVVERQPCALTRVRALESFCTTFELIDYAPQRVGQVFDVPTAIVDTLVSLGHVERVASDTPTTPAHELARR
jgi:hypothetical protein